MHGKKILITGASGMLGSYLATSFKHNDVVKCGSDFDITDINIVATKLNQENPDIIIHAAAYTDVEGGEVNVDKAFKVNVMGTQNLINYCIGKDKLFIYISSTGIYGENNGRPYTEFDDVSPTTVHHKSKYEGEKVVKNHLSKYLILRTGWLYGGEREHSKNFVYQRYLEASNNDTIYSDDSQIGNPTYIVDFMKQINVLIESRQYGVFNCVNKACDISRYSYVKKIVALFDVNCRVRIAPAGMFKRVAPVSKNESAINYKLNLLDLNVMGSWEESLSRYILKLKSEK